MKNLLTALFVVLLLTSCTEKPNIVGLWKISSVTVGGEVNTPNGRWMRFHENGSQESGNGWFQHSVGTWTLNVEENTLEVINTNGVTDPAEPFTISLSATEMTWTRTEGGQTVEVKLFRTNQLPKINSDALLGLWFLENAEGDGEFYSGGQNGGIYFRWDKRFDMYTPNGKIHGVYNVHGHKSEVELIPYGETGRSWWTLEIDDTTMKLRLLNTDSIVTRSFKRIYEFPE